MTAELLFDRLTVVGRFLSAVLGILVVCFAAIVLIVWLVLTKHTQPSATVQEAPVTHVEEDAEKQRLVNQYQAERVKNARIIADYQRENANLKAQLAELMPRVAKVDDQLTILNDAAQRTPSPMTDRELEVKTRQVLGISGKVVGR